MRADWEIKGKNSLILFFSGWGMDGNPTSHLTSREADTCTCYDYTDLGTEAANRWKKYNRITLVAWSMGVWAAETVLSRHSIVPDRAVAVNGTPFPVDDLRGIPVDTVRATCEQMDEAAYIRFFRRAVGGAGAVKRLAGRIPRREAGETKKELESIMRHSANPTEYIRWDKAYLSEKDAVFPPENMKAYWEGRIRIITLEEPHYPFQEYGAWEELTGE